MEGEGRDQHPPWSPYTHLLMDWLEDLAQGLPSVFCL